MALTAITALGVSLLATAAAQPAVPQSRPEFDAAMRAAARDVAHSERCPYTRQRWGDLSRAEPCLVRRGGRFTLALVGDSHAQQWQPAIDEIARRRNLTVVKATYKGCPANWFLLNYFDARGVARPGTACSTWRARVYRRLIERYDPDLVYVETRSHGWGIRTGDGYVRPGTRRHLALWSAAWTRTLRTLTARGAHVVVGKTTPTIPFNTPQCLLKQGPARIHRCDVPLSADSGVVPYNRIIAGLGSRAPRVTVVDATPFICPAGVCPAISDGVVVHRDDDHLTATFARKVSAQFEALLPLSSSR